MRLFAALIALLLCTAARADAVPCECQARAIQSKEPPLADPKAPAPVHAAPACFGGECNYPRFPILHAVHCRVAQVACRVQCTVHRCRCR